MITERTVFILGAGASVPYNFPSGTALKNDIQDFNVDVLIEYANDPRINSNDWKLILRGHRSILRDFFKDLMRSGADSVDAFLESKPRYETLGKALISYKLISCEDENNLYLREGNWYRYLYHNYLKEPFEDFPNNNVSFITFNYDRSLETFLFNAIRSDNDKTEEEVLEVLESIPIIHLYGTLGNLPFQSHDNSRKYEHKITKDSIEICTRNIKIVHEVMRMDKEFKKAHELLWTAHNVWFLGFGYGRKNLSRLRIPEILKNVPNVFGTTKGFRKGEVLNIYDLLKGKIKIENLDMDGELDCLSYLKEHANHIK